MLETTGDLGRPWAAIHDNQRIPADFRLYLTATPRILAAARPQKGADGQELEIATMADDPEGTYGAWLAELGLSEAIEREILTGFEIDVLEIRDPSPVIGESEEVRGHEVSGQGSNRVVLNRKRGRSGATQQVLAG
ncbi:hypothetical protein ACFW7M_35430, partial [Streptomyces sp. NPDC058739]